jgi:acyl carrier protein
MARKRWPHAASTTNWRATSARRDSMQQLENDIKELIISSLALEDLTPADIDASAPLFVNGLGLDSIDALELGLALQKRYGVSLSAESEEVRAHFASVRTLAAFVTAQGKA